MTRNQIVSSKNKLSVKVRLRVYIIVQKLTYYYRQLIFKPYNPTCNNDILHYKGIRWHMLEVCKILYHLLILKLYLIYYQHLFYLWSFLLYVLLTLFFYSYYLVSPYELSNFLFFIRTKYLKKYLSYLLILLEND